MTGDALRALLLNVDIDTNGTGCWVWAGSRSTHGYGRAGSSRTGRKATHRLLYEHFNGPIPRGLLVLHRCDNPPCCNPAHLFAGTAGDNARDRADKGRSARQSGESNGRSVLTADDVASIRVARGNGATTRTLALRYAVHPSTISLVARGLRWQES